MDILYLTYDGLTDDIGQSQILPYLLGCAAKGHFITIVSFEKRMRDGKRADIAAKCRKAGIEWRPLRFHERPPYLSKAYDFWAFERAAAALAKRKFDLIHARSYQAASIALRLKQRSGTPYLFDMRGFWADQRREGGRWTDGHLLGSRLYRHWKRREGEMLRGADGVVTLSHAAREAILRDGRTTAPVEVVPCCTDFDLFKPSTANLVSEVRRSLGWEEDDPVLGYLGSTGTVYRMGLHYRLYDAIRRRDPRAKMLFVSRQNEDAVIGEAANSGVKIDRRNVHCRSAARHGVPALVSAMDVGTCFITPTPSSLGVSPTKLAEYLACGKPVIGNHGIGDMSQVLGEPGAGHLIDGEDEASIETAADRFFELRGADTKHLHDTAKEIFDIRVAIDSYDRIYRELVTAPRRVFP